MKLFLRRNVLYSSSEFSLFIGKYFYIKKQLRIYHCSVIQIRLLKRSILRTKGVLSII